MEKCKGNGQPWLSFLHPYFGCRTLPQGYQGRLQFAAWRSCLKAPDSSYLWHEKPAETMLSNIRIVLIGTTHPGNIGAAARAMKNMGLSQHYPDAEASARASGADDLLARARVCASLDDALQGCRLVIGTSARRRSLQWPLLSPGGCAERLLRESAAGQVALLFGRESSGLSNTELDRCNYLVHIPANPDYSSLNLSQAVQVLTYELYAGALRTGDAIPDEIPEIVADAGQMEGFFQHLMQTMRDLGFADPRQSDRLQRRLRRLFLRARPDTDELNILRGLLSAAQGGKSMRRP